MALRATIENYTTAARVVKEMNIDAWEEPLLRREGGKAIKDLLEGAMTNRTDAYLREMGRQAGDRRNGHYARHLLTVLGDIELSVPRTRTWSALSVVKAYARRTAEINHLILSCFVLGLSTRKVGEALLGILGERVSAATVSRVAKTLDAAVAAFHRRRLVNRYTAILLDGVVLSRKTGAGAQRRPVLVAMGIRPDQGKEVIDFRLCHSESQQQWELFLNDLYKRGLTCEGVEVICVDGGPGLLAALDTVHPNVPIQRCWAHKIRNITDKVRKKDAEEVKKDLRKIYCAKDVVKARSAARDFADKWETAYPAAIRCLQKDLDDLLTFFRFKDPVWRKATRTTNAIERRFREVRRRTRPMGAFSDKTSIERILFAVFTYENKKQGTLTPFLMTQNS
jgi:transposase-like protein